jgi:hypothetical protein
MDSMPVPAGTVTYRKEAPVAKIDPFHTDSTEYPPSHREVYHDQSECQYGKEIKSWHRKDGTAGRPRCKKCEDLD